MARGPALRARFFVAANGVVTPRARNLTERQRVAIYRRDRFLCQYCGVRVIVGYVSRAYGAVRHAQTDHVFPVSRGGQSEPSNLVTACRECNCSKGAYASAPNLSRTSL